MLPLGDQEQGKENDWNLNKINLKYLLYIRTQLTIIIAVANK